MKDRPLFSIDEIEECCFDNIDIGYSLDKEQCDNLEDFLLRRGNEGKDAILKCVADMLDEFHP